MGEIVLSLGPADELWKNFSRAESLVKVLAEKHADNHEEIDTLTLLELTKEKLNQVRIILNKGAEDSFKSGSHNDPVMDNLGVKIEDFNKAEETAAMETKKKLEVAS